MKKIFCLLIVGFVVMGIGFKKAYAMGSYQASPCASIFYHLYTMRACPAGQDCIGFDAQLKNTTVGPTSGYCQLSFTASVPSEGVRSGTGMILWRDGPSQSCLKDAGGNCLIAGNADGTLSFSYLVSDASAFNAYDYFTFFYETLSDEVNKRINFTGFSVDGVAMGEPSPSSGGSTVPRIDRLTGAAARFPSFPTGSISPTGGTGETGGEEPAPASPDSGTDVGTGESVSSDPSLAPPDTGTQDGTQDQASLGTTSSRQISSGTIEELHFQEQTLPSGNAGGSFCALNPKNSRNSGFGWLPLLGILFVLGSRRKQRKKERSKMKKLFCLLTLGLVVTGIGVKKTYATGSSSPCDSVFSHLNTMTACPAGQDCIGFNVESSEVSGHCQLLFTAPVPRGGVRSGTGIFWNDGPNNPSCLGDADGNCLAINNNGGLSLEYPVLDVNTFNKTFNDDLYFYYFRSSGREAMKTIYFTFQDQTLPVPDSWFQEQKLPVPDGWLPFEENKKGELK